ncbi:MAG: hypothetical protein HY694_00920 [Deltaproteobacteria bacterium]|nr:hypothetical protein [Deltaproteobacteria bacterium]
MTDSKSSGRDGGMMHRWQGRRRSRKSTLQTASGGSLGAASIFFKIDVQPFQSGLKD